jgi:hypothetical protein
MIAQESLLVTLIRLVDRIPILPLPAKRGRGRPKYYPDRLFMIVRHLHRVHELLSVLDQPTAHMLSFFRLECTSSFHPNCTGCSHPRCTKCFHPNCTSNLRPECTTLEACAGLAEGVARSLEIRYPSEEIQSSREEHHVEQEKHNGRPRIAAAYPSRFEQPTDRKRSWLAERRQIRKLYHQSGKP